MRLPLQTPHLAAGLLGACALLSFSCAQILGADFDKPFLPDGTGGASTATSADVATASGSGGAGGSGGAVVTSTSAGGGAGGAPPIAECETGSGGGSDQCKIHVYVHLANPAGMDHVTDDAVLTPSSTPPGGYEATPVSTFTLFRIIPPSGVPLYTCTEKDNTHTYAKTPSCPSPILLGYAVDNIVSGNPLEYDRLYRFSTNDSLGGFNVDRSLVAEKDRDAFCPVTSPYGDCAPMNDLYAPR